MAKMPTPIKVDLDKKRTMYITLGAMHEFEEATGKSMDEMDENKIGDILHFVTAALKHEDPDLTIKEVGHFIHPGNMEEVFKAIEKAMREIAPEKEDNGLKAVANGEKQTKNKKALGWLDIWSIGRFDLGLSEDELWGLTIVHFKALMNRHNLKFEYERAIQKREDYRTGLLASLYHNSKLKKSEKSKMKDPFDWFEGKQKNLGNKSADKQKLAAMNIAKAMGGEVKL